MTIALCLNCGEMKFGAFCPCPRCEAGSSGNMELDIVFSDHNLTEDTLKGLGVVLEHFHTKTQDPAVAFWSLIRYISVNHEDILQVPVPDKFADRVSEIYSEDEIPIVLIQSSHQSPEREEGKT